jgi:hypothetical protein
MSKIFNKGILTCAQWESFHCEVVRGSCYHAMWHFHPEYQLTLVLESHGHRRVGDNITPLRPGDLVLVGANLPHVVAPEAGAAWRAGQSPCDCGPLSRYVSRM